MTDPQLEKPWVMSVKAVISDADGRQLLLRRPDDAAHFKGQWEWPGGKVDPGEDFAAALHREVREECGLEVEITGLAGSVAFELPAVRVVMVCMHARPSGGSPCLSPEHVDFRWISTADFAPLNLLEPMIPLVRRLSRPNDTP